MRWAHSGGITNPWQASWKRQHLGSSWTEQEAAGEGEAESESAPAWFSKASQEEQQLHVQELVRCLDESLPSEPGRGHRSVSCVQRVDSCPPSLAEGQLREESAYCAPRSLCSPAELSGKTHPLTVIGPRVYDTNKVFLNDWPNLCSPSAQPVGWMSQARQARAARTSERLLVCSASLW